jgi:hypothetical protein
VINLTLKSTSPRQTRNRLKAVHGLRGSGRRGMI